jgi:hypothetical protein
LGFKDAVINAAPGETNLRDKDHLLWGKSFWKDLNSFIGNKD